MNIANSNSTQRKGRLPMIGFGVLLALGIGLSGLAARHVSNSNDELVKRRFHAESQDFADRLMSRMKSYEHGLRNMRGTLLAIGEDRMTRDKFKTYVEGREITREFPGARSVGLILRVPAANENAFVKTANADGFPNFTIKQIEPHEGDRYVVYYNEPEEIFRAVIGVDLASEFTRRVALEESTRSGNATLSRPILLLNSEAGQYGVMLVLPIYRSGSNTSTPNERRAALWGWAATSLVAEQIVTSVDREHGLAIAIEDIGAEGSTLFYQTHSNDTLSVTALTAKFDHTLYDRNWRIKVAELPAFRQRLNLQPPLQTFFTGMALTILITALIATFVRLRQRRAELLILNEQLEGQVQQRTEQLHLTMRDLSSGHERLENIIRATHIGTWEVDLINEQITVNERYLGILGYTLEEFGPTTKEKIWALFHPDDLEMARARLQAHFEGKLEDSVVEVRVRHRDGTWRWVQDSGRVVSWTQDGIPSRMIGIRQDVTVRHHNDEALREAKFAAESASHAKSAFLANMSHEIRTPLNAVIGLSALLSDSALTAEQRDSIRKIQIAGTSLLAIVNNVLDLTKIEAGELEIETLPLDLFALFDDVFQLMEPQAKKKGIMLRVPNKESVSQEADATASIPQFVMGDVMRLRQILINLFANALKFTEDGQIDLRVSKISGDNEQMRLRFAVCDTGIGIKEEVLGKLFKPFSQEDSSTTRRFGGTGLGLSIVKQLVELIQGTVGVISQPGLGSEFWFEIPMLRASSPTQITHTIQDVDLTGFRVLVVDDSDINLEVARRLVAKRNMQASTCSNGQQAVDFLRAHASEIDVVLMDVQMPVMDGNTATRYIRNELGLKELPIIALTAGALVSERQRCLDSGMNDFITKPIDSTILFTTLSRHLSKQELRNADSTGVNTLSGSHPSSAIEWPKLDGFDSTTVQDSFDNDIDTYLKLLRQCVHEYSSFSTLDVPDLSDSSQRNSLAARLHKLRGSIGALGGMQIFALTRELEKLLKAEGSPTEIETQLQQLAALMTTLSQQLAVSVGQDHRADAQPRAFAS